MTKEEFRSINVNDHLRLCSDGNNEFYVIETMRNQNGVYAIRGQNHMFTYSLTLEENASQLERIEN